MSRGFGGGNIGGGSSGGLFGGSSGGSFGGSSGGSSSDDIGFDSWSNHQHHYYKKDNSNDASASLGNFSLFIVVFAMGLGIVFWLIGNNTGSTYIPMSTIQRYALPTGIAVGQVGYSTMETPPQNQDLLDSMNYFYDKTGIIPYVCYVRVISSSPIPQGYLPSYPGLNSSQIMAEFFGHSDGHTVKELFTETSAKAYARNLYNSLFNDEGHLLILHERETSPFGTSALTSSEKPKMQVWYYCGEEAATVMDTQAGRIFMAYAERYNGNMSQTFVSTADDIMTPPNNPDPGVKGLIVFIAGLLAPIVAIAAICKWFKKKPGVEFDDAELQGDEIDKNNRPRKKDRQDRNTLSSSKSASDKTYLDPQDKDAQYRD